MLSSLLPPLRGKVGMGGAMQSAARGLRKNPRGEEEGHPADARNLDFLVGLLSFVVKSNNNGACKSRSPRVLWWPTGGGSSLSALSRR